MFYRSDVLLLDMHYEVYYFVYGEVYAMRTNIDLDENLVNEAFKYTDVKTKKELIALTLREFVENRKRKDLGELRGKIKFREGYDHKSMRRGVK